MLRYKTITTIFRFCHAAIAPTFARHARALRCVPSRQLRMRTAFDDKMLRYAAREMRARYSRSSAGAMVQAARDADWLGTGERQADARCER